jgi:hypothetical protein
LLHMSQQQRTPGEMQRVCWRISCTFLKPQEC